MMQAVDHLDLITDAESAVMPRTFDGDTWTAADFELERCLIRLNVAAREEVARVADEMRLRPLPLLLRSPNDFDMERLRDAMEEVKTALDVGPGIAIVDSLPLETLAQDEAITLFWMLGHLVGRPVAQSWDGTMLYDVTDTGKPFIYGVRGSRTRETLVFHTDNSSGFAMPDYIGLLCLRQAIEGGESRFCNLGTVHNRLLAEYPSALERLYRPLYYDRQTEHADGKPKVSFGPMFYWEEERLRVRANLDLVRKGYDVAGVALDEETAAALRAVELVTSDPSLWVALPLERGQLQYLNNRRVAHYRGEYRDADDPTLKRHLVRAWHRDAGRPTFDG